MKYFLRLCEGKETASAAGERPIGRSAANRIAGRIIGLGIVSALSIGVPIVAHAQASRLLDMVDESRLLLLHSHSQGYMGIFVGDVEPERAQALHLKDIHGAEITVLDHDAPAAKVGLRLHDVVMQINGLNIDGAEQMRAMLKDLPVGRKVAMVVNRDGVLQTVTLQMADRRKMQEEVWQQLGSSSSSKVEGQTFLAGGNDVPTDGFHLWGFGSSLHIGALVEPLTPQTSEFLGVTGGLIIKNVAHKSAADLAGLRPRDVILQVANDAVVTTADWERLVRSSDGKPVQVTIFRDQSKRVVTLELNAKRH